MHYQRVTALSDQDFYRIALFFCLMIAVTNQHILLMALRDHIYRFNQCTKKRVGNVHDDDTNGVAALRCQRLCVGIGPVTQHGYLFFYNDTATTEIYTLSLHDALPI